MTETEAKDFIKNELESRWPTWRPTGAILWDWIEKLRPFAYEAVRQAVKEHFMKSKSSKPFMIDVLTLARNIHSGHSEIQKESYEPTVFVQCIEGDCLGQFSAVMPPSYSTNPDTINNCAEYSRKKHNEVYGGVWVVRTSMSHELMRKEQKEMAVPEEDDIPF